MRKQFLLYSAVTFCALGSQADVLSPQQALDRLSAQKKVYKAAGRDFAVRPELAHTFEAAGKPSVYVFNDLRENGGYFILSADDSAPAVLGYTDSGEPFDLATAPPNMVKWLEGYSAQIARASQYGRKAPSQARVPQGRADVAPKTETLWDQGYPYNSWCPLSGGKSTYTGCVATAMAQILYWHKLSHKPAGMHEYTIKFVGTYQIDMDTVNFNWDKMSKTYDDNSPYESKAAVAGLMKACGYAANMEYSTWGSGAASMRAAYGMAQFFGFDKGVSIQERDWYGNSEWDALVYDELTTNGPVYYDGTGDGGGHAFVCDGYNATDGLYHFNWGWSGSSNGYYRLDALVPEDQGAGGVSIGYSWGQGIMRGLKQAQDGSQAVYQIRTGCGVRSPWEKQALGKNVSLTGYETNDGFRNCSNDMIPQVSLGVQFKNKATNEIRNTNEIDNIYTMNPTPPADWEYAKSQLVICYGLPADLQDGDYEVRPIFKSGDGQWQYLKGNASIRQYVSMHVENDSAYYSLGEPEARLNVVIEEIPDYFTTADSYTLRCKVTNNGTADYTGEICSVFIGENEKGLYVAAQGYHRYTPVNVGETVEFEYTSTNPTGKIVDGEYLLTFGDCNSGEIIGEAYPAYVGNRFGEIKFHYYNLNIENSNMLDADNVHVKWSMECPQGTYDGPMALIVSKTKKPFNADYSVLSEPVHFEAVETRDVEFTGVLRGPQVGDIVYAIPGYLGSEGELIPIGTNPITMIIMSEAHTTGIEDLLSDKEIVSVTVMDLAGHIIADGLESAVDLKVLGAGTYIVIGNYADGTRKASKVLLD